jgi:hypothetical protein
VKVAIRCRGRDSDATSHALAHRGGRRLASRCRSPPEAKFLSRRGRRGGQEEVSKRRRTSRSGACILSPRSADAHASRTYRTAPAASRPQGGSRRKRAHHSPSTPGAGSPQIRAPSAGSGWNSARRAFSVHRARSAPHLRPRRLRLGLLGLAAASRGIMLAGEEVARGAVAPAATMGARSGRHRRASSSLLAVRQLWVPTGGGAGTRRARPRRRGAGAWRRRAGARGGGAGG